MADGLAIVPGHYATAPGLRDWIELRAVRTIAQMGAGINAPRINSGKLRVNRQVSRLSRA